MLRKLLTTLAAFVLVAVAAPSAQAGLAAVGPPIDPHGFPAYYEDSNGLQLELCVPPPAGFADPGFCVFDPLDETSDIIVAGEVFWWLASAVVDPTGVDGDGRAVLTLGLEGTFGGPEDPVDGQQISFARVRVRVDTPVAGTYTVTHPFGVLEFEVAPGEEADGINYTADIGAANFLDPAAGFAGALHGSIGPFLTWPDYETDETLVDANGARYVGDPRFPNAVVGSPFDTNFFQVEGPEGFETAFTEEFSLMGKVYVQQEGETVHTFPEAPLPKLFAVGPVNRVEPFVTPTTATVTGVDIENYAVGYPIWYQENIGTIAEPVGGLRLMLCDPGPPTGNPPVASNTMCISDGIDPTDPDQVALRTGGEGFWWSTDAGIDLPGDEGDQALLVLGLEATFGGSEALIDGQQITFGRERIRIDTNDSGAGTYRVTHPYGVRIFEDVPADDRGINFTADIGIADPPVYLNDDPVANPVPIGGDPDGAMIGALFSDIGPRVLKWTTFNENPALTDPLLIGNFNGVTTYHVGNPAVEHEVVGSPIDFNMFRVEKLVSGDPTSGEAVWDVLGETDVFAVSGQIFDPTLLGLPPEGGVPSLIGVFRNGDWYIDADGDGVYNAAIDTRYRFGATGDLPVAGDWNGNGVNQLGVFRNGDWYIDTNGNGIWDQGVDTRYRFGTNSDLAVTGDWDGNGTSGIGVFRNGNWYIDANGNGIWEQGTDIRYRFGTTGDIPVVGDWNGDGTSQIGVFRNGDWYIDTNGNGIWEQGIDTRYRFGTTGDIPVVGDWNGDGTSQIGVFRNGDWYIDANGNGIWEQGIDVLYRFGTAGDKPIAGL